MGRVYALDISDFTNGYSATDTISLDTAFGGGNGYVDLANQNKYGGMDVDGKGNIYVTNEAISSRGQVWKINSNGDAPKGPLVSYTADDMVDVAYYAGKLYTTDEKTGKIIVFDATDGTYKYTLTNANLTGAYGIEIDSNGYLYVANPGADVIYKSNAPLP